MLTKQATLESVRALDGIADDRYIDISEASVVMSDEPELVVAVEEAELEVTDDVELAEEDEDIVFVE